MKSQTTAKRRQIKNRHRLFFNVKTKKDGKAKQHPTKPDLPGRQNDVTTIMVRK
jgi:hypothetical protein